MDDLIFKLINNNGRDYKTYSVTNSNTPEQGIVEIGKLFVYKDGPSFDIGEGIQSLSISRMKKIVQFAEEAVLQVF